MSRHCCCGKTKSKKVVTIEYLYLDLDTCERCVGTDYEVPPYTGCVEVDICKYEDRKRGEIFSHPVMYYLDRLAFFS